MRMRRVALALLLTASLILLAACAGAKRVNRTFSNWPAGSSPAEIGKRVAENFVVRQFDYQTNPRRQYVIYQRCAPGTGP